MVLQTFDVTPLPASKIGPVWFFLHTFHCVIPWIAVGKPVGHHQVHGIAAVESLPEC